MLQLPEWMQLPGWFYALYATGILPLIPISIFIAIVLAIIYGFISDEIGYRFSHREFATGFFSVLALTSLSVTIGFLAGSADEPVFGAVLPAVLSFVGGISVFIIGKREQSPKLIGLVVFGFSFTLLVGAAIGTYQRAEARWARINEVYSLERQIELARWESQIRAMREAFGLPPEPVQY